MRFSPRARLRRGSSVKPTSQGVCDWPAYALHFEAQPCAAEIFQRLPSERSLYRILLTSPHSLVFRDQAGAHNPTEGGYHGRMVLQDCPRIFTGIPTWPTIAQSLAVVPRP
jgi:hypothetical protein